MQTGTIKESNRTSWLLALMAAAGTTFAPAAMAQDEDPIAGMLRSMTQSGGGQDSVDDPLSHALKAAQNAQSGQTPDGNYANSDEADLEALEDDISVDENMIVELHVQDEDLGNVLQMLSIQSQRNIVSSRNVSATVTANLYGVTFFEALDAILHVNGYGYVEQGNFIYVYTLEEMATIEQATRERVAESITLDFLNAIDAAEFVTPLLSEGGFIKTNGRTADFSIGGESPVGADNYANSAMLVVFDYPENIEEIQRLIDEIDTRPAQVLVEATIVQTTLNEANAFGVDFSMVADLNIEDFINSGGPLGPVDGLLGGVGERFIDGARTPIGLPGDGEARAIQSTPGNTSGPSTFKLGIIDEDVSVFVRMLDEVSDTTILSSPKILALNRQPSRVLVGRKVGYLSTTSTQTSTTQTVEFLDTGTQLYFRPFVSDDGMIRMELKPQVSEAIIRNQTDATGAAVTIPDEITNEIVTNVLVPDGHTIVLGGLFRDSTTAARRQVPILGDLPLIGAAFRGHEDETNRSEIIFMIKPSILADEVLIDQGDKSEDYVRRIRAGSREGLLPWSRERQSSQLLVEAERLAAEGKTDRALHCVRRALEHNPFQPDAIAMRERLMNEEAVWPHRNLLRDVIENELFDAPADQAPTGSMSRGSYKASPVSSATTTNGQFTKPTTSTQVAASETKPLSATAAPVAHTPTGQTNHSVAVDAASPSMTPSTATGSAASPSNTLVATPMATNQSATNQAVTNQFVTSPEAINQPVATPTSMPNSTPAVQTGTFNEVVAEPVTTSQTAGSRFSDLQLTPLATNTTPASTAHSSSRMDGLTLTRAPIQAAPTSSVFNDPTMKPTGSVTPAPISQGSISPTVTPTVTPSVSPTASPALKPTAQATPAVSAPVVPGTEPQATVANAAEPTVAQTPSEFGLKESEVRMLMLSEFFRSFATSEESQQGPFTEVPTEADSPE